MTNTFTKFDQLGSVLSELSFTCIGLNVHHYDDGEKFFYVNVHPVSGVCYSANGKTPSEALEKALQETAEGGACRIELFAERVAA